MIFHTFVLLFLLAGQAWAQQLSIRIPVWNIGDLFSPPTGTGSNSAAGSSNENDQANAYNEYLSAYYKNYWNDFYQKQAEYGPHAVFGQLSPAYSTTTEAPATIPTTATPQSTTNNYMSFCTVFPHLPECQGSSTTYTPTASTAIPTSTPQSTTSESLCSVFPQLPVCQISTTTEGSTTSTATPTTDSTTFESSTTSTAIPPTDSTTLADSTTSTAIPPTDSTTLADSTTSTAIPPTDSTTTGSLTTSTAVPPTDSTTLADSTTSTAIPPTDSTTTGSLTTSTAVPPTDSTTTGSLTTSTALPTSSSTTPHVEPTTESLLCITFPHLPVCQGAKTVHLEGGNIGSDIAELKPDQQLSIISEPHSVTSLCFYYPRLCMKPEQAQFVRLSDGTGKPLLLISPIIEGRPSSQDHPTLWRAIRRHIREAASRL